MGSISDNTSGEFYGYRMSKTAVNMAGYTLSIDLRKHGVAVGIIHPGFVSGPSLVLFCCCLFCLREEYGPPLLCGDLWKHRAAAAHNSPGIRE